MVGLEDAFARGAPGSRKPSSAQEYPYEPGRGVGVGGGQAGSMMPKTGPGLYQNGYSSVTEETLEETLVSSENDAGSEGDIFSDEDDREFPLFLR